MDLSAPKLGRRERTTAFNYFPHKEDFVVAIVDDRREQVRTTMTLALARQERIADALRWVMRELAGWFADNPRLTRMLSRATLQSGVLLHPDYH